MSIETATETGSSAGPTAGTVVVLGAGLMGSGIAQVAAAAGWQVTMRDVGRAELDRGLSTIHESLTRFVAKKRISPEDAAATLERITPTTDLDAISAADLLVEAVFEHVDVKHQVFREFDRLAKDDAVLATNTSAIPITTIATATERPERVVGTHFFSPVPLMPLLEVIRGRRTSSETLERAREFGSSIGKTCVDVNRDVAGFVTTRLISALVMEAVRLYEAGVASAEDIDAACKLGLGHAMGPLATADLTGVDVLTHATRNIWNETADAQFHPPEVLSRMVEAGELGRKSGRGFYTYDDE